MCQSVPAGYDAPVLKPHVYPLWIKLFAVSVVGLVVASFGKFPDFYFAAKKERRAEILFDNKEYAESAKLDLEVLKKFPESRKARIGAAQALFAQRNDDAAEQGFSLLTGIQINDSEWKHLTKVMPDKIKKRFKTKKDDDD